MHDIYTKPSNRNQVLNDRLIEAKLMNTNSSRKHKEYRIKPASTNRSQATGTHGPPVNRSQPHPVQKSR